VSIALLRNALTAGNTRIGNGLMKYEIN